MAAECDEHRIDGDSVSASPPEASAPDTVTHDDLRAKLKYFGTIMSSMVSSIFAENLGPKLEAQTGRLLETAQLFDGRI